MALPTEEGSINYLCFQFQDQMFQFCVLPFGLNDAPRAFTKSLVPSQVVIFLGFIVDSNKMFFSLPDSKIQ